MRGSKAHTLLFSEKRPECRKNHFGAKKERLEGDVEELNTNVLLKVLYCPFSLSVAHFFRIETGRGGMRQKEV